MLFDNEPVESIPAKSKMDTLTTLNLVYSLILKVPTAHKENR